MRKIRNANKILLENLKGKRPVTNSMEQNFSWDANSHSACHEIPHLLWNLKVHYHVHKNLQEETTSDDNIKLDCKEIDCEDVHGLDWIGSG